MVLFLCHSDQIFRGRTSPTCECHGQFTQEKDLPVQGFSPAHRALRPFSAASLPLPATGPESCFAAIYAQRLPLRRSRFQQPRPCLRSSWRAGSSPKFAARLDGNAVRSATGWTSLYGSLSTNSKAMAERRGQRKFRCQIHYLADRHVSQKMAQVFRWLVPESDPRPTDESRELSLVAHEKDRRPLR